MDEAKDKKDEVIKFIYTDKAGFGSIAKSLKAARHNHAWPRRYGGKRHQDHQGHDIQETGAHTRAPLVRDPHRGHLHV